MVAHDAFGGAEDSDGAPGPCFLSTPIPSLSGHLGSEERNWLASGSATSV